ncbi:MAG: transposase [Brevefilum sp.]|nr:transposase [Brevefilum sp.]
MDKQPDRHRKNVRLKDYDYASPGYYFVSIVSYERKNIFGEIIDGEMNLNQAGKTVEQTWQDIPKHFPNTSCEIFVVMPNHIHGIINIIDDEIVRAQSIRGNGVKPKSIGSIIGSFKSAVTKQLHQTKTINQERIWQRNYYEHIIRDEDDYQQITDYIAANPINWGHDLKNLRTSNHIQKPFCENHANQSA